MYDARGAMDRHVQPATQSHQPSNEDVASAEALERELERALLSRANDEAEKHRRLHMVRILVFFLFSGLTALVKCAWHQVVICVSSDSDDQAQIVA